jgi:hypothetical protein
MDELLGQLFTTQSIAASMAILPEIHTRVMDDIYPESVRATHEFAHIGVDELTQIAHAVPVVRRGTQSYALGGGNGKVQYIEPQPIDTNYFISAKELNDVKMLSKDGQQTWVNNKLDFGRKTLRATAEALACQSLTGSINFPMKVDGGFDTYTLSFGTVGTVTPTKMFNATGATIGDVNDTLNKMAEALEDSGFGMKVEFRCGAAVESFLVGLIGALSNDTRIIAKVDASGIQIGRHTIKMLKGRYRNPQTETYANAIGDNDLLAIDMESGFRFRYLAIDDLDAGLAATQIFVNPLKSTDPSGWKLIYKSTPLPIPVVSAMKKATVLS